MGDGRFSGFMGGEAFFFAGCLARPFAQTMIGAVHVCFHVFLGFWKANPSSASWVREKRWKILELVGFFS